MSIIKVENLTFSYASSYDNIFEEVSFIIDTNWKTGLIGRNGRGKTTFLNLLLNKYKYDGKIISSVKFDYFPYPVADKNRITIEILSEISPTAEEWEFIRELSYLDTESDILWRTFDTLSNGEQTKALLAALFLNDEHFLLIDEPTNHLDAKARETIASYLKKKKGFILVSHDRNVLDICVDHILALNRTNIEVRKGNFSTWMKNFENQQDLELSQNEKLKKEIKRLETASKRTAVWSDKVESSKTGAADKGYVGHKAAKMMKRSKSIESRHNEAVEQKSSLLKNIENADDLKIFPLRHYSDVLVRFESVSPVYNGESICSPVSFEIKQGERVFLNGKNGSGKSSLLKLITGDLIEHVGEISMASDLIVSYVMQDTSDMNGTLSEYAYEYNIDEVVFKSILRKMDFERVQFEKDISDFSEGQKKKVLIARSLCEKAHIYVWDEPLNFIDIYSRKQIENLISKYNPTMILVEHDKAFRDTISTKIIEL
ncbi:MAG: ABC-F type ribosomal protection protein [Ruminococcus sp.]|nr:ABC-F type ribosomal protection protein [Ruminococcus sp.]